MHDGSTVEVVARCYITDAATSVLQQYIDGPVPDITAFECGAVESIRYHGHINHDH